MSLRVDVEVSTGKFETVPYSKATYEKPLNGTRYFDVLVDGNNEDFRNDFQIGRKIYFYWLDALDIKGKILKVSNTSTGELRLEGVGWGERILSQPKTVEQGFSATTTTGVVNSGTNNLLSFVNGITAGTLENQTVNDFRTYTNQNVLEALGKVTKLTDQDWSIDDANDELDVLDHQGSSSTIGTLTDGKDTFNVMKEDDETEKVTKITVLGKGFGANQISGVWGDGGVNAPDHTQGDNEETVIDKSISTTTEAQNLAEATYGILSASRLSYKFRLVNPYFSHALGDVITLDAPKIGVDSTNLRIVATKRIVTPKNSMLAFEVRATTEREASIDALSQQKALSRAYREAVSFTQPSDNANAGSGTLGTDSHLHADGTYGTDSHLHGSSYSTDNHLHGSSYSTDNHLHGSSYTANSSTSNNTAILVSEGSDTASPTLSSGGNANVLSVAVNGSYDYLIVEYLISLNYSPGTPLNLSIEFDGIGTAMDQFKVLSSALGSIRGSVLVPIHGSVNGNETMDVYVLSGSTGNVDVSMVIYGWFINHSHSIPSTGVSGNSTNTAPGVSGNSTNTAPGVSGNSTNTSPGVSGNSEFTAPGVSGNTDDHTH